MLRGEILIRGIDSSLPLLVFELFLALKEGKKSTARMGTQGVQLFGRRNPQTQDGLDVIGNPTAIARKKEETKTIWGCTPKV